MRINVNQVSSNAIELEKSSTGKVSNQASAAATSTVQDTATLKNDTATVASLQMQALSYPDVRQGKVDTLKQQVTTGTYQMSSNETAQGIRENGL